MRQAARANFAPALFFPVRAACRALPIGPMSGIFFYLAAAACLITLVILMVGIGGFGTGKASPRFSNRMMRYRIVAQAVAIVLLLMMVWFAKQGL